MGLFQIRCNTFAARLWKVRRAVLGLSRNDAFAVCPGNAKLVTIGSFSGKIVFLAAYFSGSFSGLLFSGRS